jgi:hypothetical protein
LDLPDDLRWIEERLAFGPEPDCAADLAVRTGIAADLLWDVVDPQAATQAAGGNGSEDDAHGFLLGH